MVLKESNKNLQKPDVVAGLGVLSLCLNQASVDVFACLCQYELDVDSSESVVFA